MRSLLMSVIFLGIVGYLGSLLYDRWIVGDHFDSTGEAADIAAGVSVGSSLSYPDRIAIQSADGRDMTVNLLGRNATHIQFSRDDGQEFVYAINLLARDSQALVEQYPNVGVRNAAKHMDKGEMDVGDLYVQELEREIREIDGKLNDITSSYNSSSSKVERRTLRREAEGLMAEKADLSQKISERQ